MRALRRDPHSADRFPQDVLELQGYLDRPARGSPASTPSRARAPNVPLYILGSSLFGAQLAAALGLPYAFASHFAPQALHAGGRDLPRASFQPSEQLAEPYVIAGVNVIAADTERRGARAAARVASGCGCARSSAGAAPSPTPRPTPSWTPAPGAQIEQMMHYTAVGTPAEVRDYLDEFAEHADADELIVASMARSTEATLRSFEMVAQVMELAG